MPKQAKTKVQIKNLGTAEKKIDAVEAKSIRGGVYSCPSKRCYQLIVKVAAELGMDARKRHIIKV